MCIRDSEEDTPDLFNSDADKTMTIFSDKKDQSSWGFNLYINNGLTFDFTINNGELVSLNSEVSVSDVEWHFVAVVRGQNHVELWLDGELVGQMMYAGEIDYTDSPIYFGQNPEGTNPFQGLLDSIRFSDIARHKEDFMTGGGVVEFISDSYDYDGQLSDSNYIWSSAIDGELGRGRIFYHPVDNFSQGSHSIQLHVIDSNGTQSNPSSTVLIIMERPSAIISSVKVNNESVWSGFGPTVVNRDDMVTLEGTTGSEQLITEYFWTSDLDGDLSTSNSFTSITLSNGTNIISFQLKAGNGLWSSVQTLKLDINGRPIFGGYQISNTSIYRLDTITVNVSVSDDNYPGSDLVYSVGYSLIGQGVPTYDDTFFSDVQYNSVTQSLEFQFTPDQFSEMGLFELHVKATDALGAAYDYTILDTAIEVKNNPPVLDLTVLPEEFMELNMIWV